MKNKAIKITGFAFTVFVLNSCTTDSLSDLTIVQEIESELCIEDDPINLFSLLDESVDQSGTWIDVNNSGGLQGSIFNPSSVIES